MKQPKYDFWFRTKKDQIINLKYTKKIWTEHRDKSYVFVQDFDDDTFIIGEFESKQESSDYLDELMKLMEPNETKPT